MKKLLVVPALLALLVTGCQAPVQRAVCGEHTVERTSGGTGSGAIRVGDLGLFETPCGLRVTVDLSGGTPAWEAGYSGLPAPAPGRYAPQDAAPGEQVLTVALAPADPTWEPRRYRDRQPGGTLHLQIRDRNPGAPWVAFVSGEDGRALVRIGLAGAPARAYRVDASNPERLVITLAKP